jgi:hypothetical protein
LPDDAFEFRGGRPELTLRPTARTRWVTTRVVDGDGIEIIKPAHAVGDGNLPALPA